MVGSVHNIEQLKTIEQIQDTEQVSKADRFKSRLQSTGDIFLLGSIAVYLLFLMLATTTFYLPFPRGSSVILLALCGIAAAYRLLFHVREWKQILPGMLCAIVCGFTFLSGRYPFLLFLGVLIPGCFRISYRNVLKVYTIVSAFFLVVTFLSALSGGIENFIYLKDGYIRSSLGIIYPTDMASAVLFLLCAAWVAWDGLTDEVAIVLGLICVWFCKVIAMSITSTICSAGLVLLAVIHWVVTKIAAKRQFPGWSKKIVELALILVFPLCGVLMFALIYAYSRDMAIALKINNIITNRLGYALEAWREHGLHPFGSAFDMLGNGGSIYAYDAYTFIDISYLLIVIRYGWVMFGMLCVTWGMTVCRTIYTGNWRMALVMALICLHSLSEHHFTELNYNIFLILPFASFERKGENASECDGATSKQTLTRKTVLRYALWFGGAPILCLILPGFLSRIRTILQILGWQGGGYNGVKVFLLIAGIILSVSGILWGLYGTICYWKSSQKKAIVRCGCAAVCLLILGLGYMRGEHILDYGAKKYASILNADRDAVRTILESKTGHVYAEPYPELYQRKYGDFSSSIFTGEDLGRLYDTTVIMNLDKDASCMLRSGFLFTPISEEHAIYTNDFSVAEALKEEGYHLTGYYSVEKEVDLYRLGRMNGLEADAEGIELDGEEASLEFGPYVPLHTATYTVEYDFALPEGKTYGETTLLGNVYVTAYNGEKKLKEAKVLSNQFDEDGRYSLPVTFYSANYPDVEFIVLMEDGQKVKLSGISYRQSPKYDEHNLYNQQRKNYRDEYYDLEGNPTITEDGYAACEYEYNADGFVTEVRYYDADNQPVMLTMGYARQVRTLNLRNQIVRLEYYDEHNEPVMLPEGYWAEEREYDQDKNITVRRYKDKDDQPVVIKSGYTQIRRVFDGEKRVIREEYYGPDGTLMAMTQGHAALERDYDAVGNCTTIRYYGTDGLPVITTWNYAEIRRRFDDKKQIIEEAYYDNDGQLMALPAGYAFQTREYDAAGNVIRYCYLDADRKPVMTTSHYAELRREYNPKRQTIRESYYDAEGNPTPMPQGYYINERAYDEAGNANVQKYEDADGNLMITSWKYAEVHRVYDDQKRVLEESYYDTQGKLMTLPSGQAYLQREYDDVGNTIVYRYYDLDHQMVMTTAHYAELHRSYNERRQIAWEAYYDTKGKPTAMPQGYYSQEYERDEKGNAAAQKFFDIDGKPMMTTWGYAEIRREFNDNNKAIKESYFDTEGNPTMLEKGYCVKEMDYGEDGKVSAERYYDIMGNQIKIE